MLNETLTETTDAVRGRLRELGELASEGLDRSPEVLTDNAAHAARTARTWMDDLADGTAEWLSDDERRDEARTWIAAVVAGTVAVIGTIWLIRRIRARRRRKREERATTEVRHLIESNAPVSPTSRNRRGARTGTGSRAAS